VRHADHVALLRDGVPPGGVWADLGSGEGAFTLALAELLGPGGGIHSVDTDAGALRTQQRAMSERFPDVTLEVHRGDFTRPLELPPLDGIVMANSLHFHRDHAAVVRHVTSWLRPGGHFVLVEYDADRGNTWVPHPISYATWEQIAGEAGLADTRRLQSVPSRFLRAIYSAVSIRRVST
jgi:SAM-dependent methyltransferase